jgi:oxygen-independent coproporphyrinogen-3 oxidase
MSGRSWTEAAVRRVRDWLAGPDACLEFRPVAEFEPRLAGPAGLYLHVPFCRSLCPYCPYLRQRYRAGLIAPYLQSLRRESEWYASRLPGLRVTSVYFGGGTPTVLDESIEGVVEHLSRLFNPAGPFCIETNPADLTPDKVRVLERCGFGAVSLGVQSFDPATLAAIGRGDTAAQADRALQWLAASSIRSVNVDLMFAIPGQSAESWQDDIEHAAASGATQITAYPLFTFPYSSAGRMQALRNMRMPPLGMRRRMYYQLYDTLSRLGFRRESVWSFSRPGNGHRFSSVTRDRYLGLGPEAGSFTGPLFTFNTFSLDEYQRSVADRGHAVALAMAMPIRLQILHDLYWRLYETSVPTDRHSDWLEYRLADIPRVGPLLHALRLLGMHESSGDALHLTRRGSFWVHWLQNYVALPAVNTLWTRSTAAAWPGGVVI